MFDKALRVARLNGKSLLRQVVEIIRLKQRNPTLGATEYYRFRLYDPEYTASSRPEDYLGWRAEQQLALALNPRTAVTPAWDKLTFTLIARAFDLPVPGLIALYRSRTHAAAHVAEAIADGPDALATWLRTNTRWPVFAKPSYSQQSLGCFHLTGYQSDGDVLVTRRGEKLPVERFVSDVVEAPNGPFYQREMGYLFQEVLRPHEQIARLTGSQSISCARVVLIQDSAGVEVVATIWKIAAGENDSDQMSARYVGNLLGGVDPASGRVGPIIDYQGLIVELPGAARLTDGFVLPDWEQALALCRRAAAVFPLMRIQHWDVALTDRGPCLLEVNDIGAIAGLQCFGRGLLTDRMRALLRSHADAAKIPWIRRLCG
jgi:hypothetical protein